MKQNNSKVRRQRAVLAASMRRDEYGPPFYKGGKRVVGRAPLVGKEQRATNAKREQEARQAAREAASG